MKRETTNRIRFVLEELIPPIIRDSAFMHWLQRQAWGPHITRLSEFRENSAFLTTEEYEVLYREHPRVHDGTDNSEGCVRAILRDVVGTTICDVGCGTGHLLRRIDVEHSGKNLTGVDFVIDTDQPEDGITYIASMIEEMPFDDNAFDTVVCTHVIEHLLEPHKAVAELRRITARRLIIVVPQEREYKYSFNPHFNFFPYVGSFLRVMVPVPTAHEVRTIGRDIYYREDIT